ncbi:MAG: DUF3108 domain-containing protein [Cyclobacteriaceae bacterium]
MFHYSTSTIAHAASSIRLVSIFFLLFLFEPASAQKEDHPFKVGEVLTYSMHFGWFEVGEAEFWIDPELRYINGDAYYSVQGEINTSSWARIFKAITGCFESLIHVETLQPLRSHRTMNSGKKTVDVRTDNFTYSDSLKIHTYVEDVDEHRYRSFPRKENIPMRDFLSTFLLLRTVQFNDNQPLDMRSFYSNTLYELRVIPGREKEYDLKKKKITSREYKLEFPKNEYFKKGKNGSAIVSEESDRRPLRIEIDMALGSFYLKLDDES